MYEFWRIEVKSFIFLEFVLILRGRDYEPSLNVLLKGFDYSNKNDVLLSSFVVVHSSCCSQLPRPFQVNCRALQKKIQGVSQICFNCIKRAYFVTIKAHPLCSQPVDRPRSGVGRKLSISKWSQPSVAWVKISQSLGSRSFPISLGLYITRELYSKTKYIAVHYFPTKKLPCA